MTKPEAAADNGVGLPPGVKIGVADSFGLRRAHLWVAPQPEGTRERSGPPEKAT